MGLDLRAVPVRLDSPAVRAIRRDAGRWEEAGWRPPFVTADTDDGPLPEISRELLAGRSADQDHVWRFPGRTHHQAEYLLDPAGYRALTGWEQRERSLPYRVVHGDRPFAPHATGTQGSPWRCSGRGFLSAAADLVDGLDVAAVRREFSVADMEREAVYKAFVRDGVSDDEVFDRLLAGLRALACYYREVAASGYDLIFILD